MEKYTQLPNGQMMPLLGFGTAFPPEDRLKLEEAINLALSEGYRHFDTAYQYKTEEVLGKVIKEWITAEKVTRQELFVTTKLPGIGIDESLVEHFLNKSLEALQLDFVDLYLIHWPVGLKYIDDDTMFPMTADGKSLNINLLSDFVSVWKKMEEQVKTGKAKAIGISNFNFSQIERLLKRAEISPANLQIEANVYFQQKLLREFCQKHNITITAYAPLGSPGRSEKQGYPNPNILEDPTLCSIAQAKGKTTSQIALKFLVQQGIAVIPKSSNPERIAQNSAIFEFCLSVEEMRPLQGLDKGESGRKFITSVFPGASSHPECPY